MGTTDTFDASTTLAKTVVAGEYISHQCGHFAEQSQISGSDKCSDNPRCAGLTGSCCPTPLGKTLSCCSGAVGSRHVGDTVIAPSTTEEPKPEPKIETTESTTTSSTSTTVASTTPVPTTTTEVVVAISTRPWWENIWVIIGGSVSGAFLLGVLGVCCCSDCSSNEKRPKKNKRGVSRDMALADSFPTVSSYSSTQADSEWDPTMPLFGTPALRVPALQQTPGVPMMSAGPLNWA